MKNGRRVDVLTIIGDKTIAIEVETGRGIQSKLTVLEEVDKLIIVIDDRAAINKVSKYEAFEKVKVYHIADFLRYLKANYSSDTHENKSIKSDKAVPNLKLGNKAGKKGNKEVEKI